MLLVEGGGLFIIDEGVDIPLGGTV